MASKTFSIISGMASIISLIITITQWQTSNVNLKILFIIAIFATALLSYFIYKESNLRTKVVPELIHLKGACATSHELSDIVNTLSQDDVNDERVQKILKLLSNSVARRIQDISSKNQELYRVADRIATSFGKDVQIEELKLIIREVYQSVHRIDRDRLKQENLESFVYHDIG